MIAIDKSTWVVPPCPPGQLRSNYAGPSSPGFCVTISPVGGPVKPIYVSNAAAPAAPASAPAALSPTVLVLLALGGFVLLARAA